MKSVAFNAKLASMQCLTTHYTNIGIDAALARKAEVAFQMRFRPGDWRQQIHSLINLHKALLAFALFAARRRHANPQHSRAVKKRHAARRGTLLVIKMKFNRHANTQLNETQYYTPQNRPVSSFELDDSTIKRETY